MLKGKTHAALDLLANHGKGGVLHLGDRATPDDPHSLSVKDVLQSKHPPGQPTFQIPSYTVCHQRSTPLSLIALMLNWSVQQLSAVKELQVPLVWMLMIGVDCALSLSLLQPLFVSH